jgi:hypothetical protein
MEEDHPSGLKSLREKSVYDKSSKFASHRRCRPTVDETVFFNLQRVSLSPAIPTRGG